MRLLLVPVSLLLAANAYAANVTLSHSGYVLDAADAPLNAPSAALRFRIWDDPTSGNAVWDSGSCTVSVAHGYYAVTLGGGCGPALTTTELPPDATRWLEVNVGLATLTPRQAVAPLPVAVLARDSQQLGGHDPSWFLDEANHTGVVPAGRLPLATTSSAGALAAADKVKLDALPSGLSGTAPMSVTGGVVAIVPATTSAAGSLSAADKAKLDGLPGVIAGAGPITVTGTSTATVAIADATPSTSGSMSAADKAKLDGLSGSAGVGVGTTLPSTNLTAGLLFLLNPARDLYLYDGLAWRVVQAGVNTYASCAAVLAAGKGSGVYNLDLDGTGGDPPVDLYCDNSNDNGGWTLVGQISGRYDLYSTWLRTKVNAANLQSAAIEPTTWSSVNAVAFAVNTATTIRFTNSTITKWLKWPLPGGRTTGTWWNHAAGQATINSATQTTVTVTSQSGSTGTCYTNVYGIMPLQGHGGSYPAATMNAAGNTQGNDLCVSIGVLTTTPSADGFSPHGNGFDGPSNDTDWPNAAINVDPSISVWLR